MQSRIIKLPSVWYNLLMFSRLTSRSLSSHLLSSIFYFLFSIFFLNLLTGCAFQLEEVLINTGLITPSPTPDPFFHYRAALQPWAQGDIEAVTPLPRYHITAELNEAGTDLQGVAQVIVPTSSSELVF